MEVEWKSIRSFYSFTNNKVEPNIGPIIVFFRGFPKLWVLLFE